MIRRLANAISRRIRASSTSSTYPELQVMIDGLKEVSALPRGVVFGDSVAMRISSFDSDRRSLVKMIEDELAGRASFVPVTHSAYHLGVYRALLSVLEFKKLIPEFVVIPINLRSFSPQWSLEPSWQFEEELACVEAYMHSGAMGGLQRSRDLVAEYDAYDLTRVNVVGSALETVGEFRLLAAAKPETVPQEKFRNRQLFLYHYCSEINSNHSRLVALRSCLDVLRKCGIPTLIYVTPVNFQSGRLFAGEEFTIAMRSNIKLISAQLEFFIDNDLVFKDYSELLQPDSFFHAGSKTEHLNQLGRHALARCLSGDVVDLLSYGGSI